MCRYVGAQYLAIHQAVPSSLVPMAIHSPALPTWHSIMQSSPPPCSLCARWRRRSVSFAAPNGVTTAAGLNILVERIAPTEIIYQIATHYILGCDDEVGNGCKTHFVKADSAELAKNGSSPNTSNRSSATV